MLYAKPIDLELPARYSDRLIDYSPARQALYKTGEEVLKSLREHPFNLGWNLRLLYNCS